MLATFATLLVVPWLNVANGTLPSFHPLATAAPVVSLMSLNLLGKMGFGAFGGFEYVAIHAGECRNPVRTIARVGGDRGADHRRHVHLRHQLGAGAGAVRSDRSDRADSAGAEHRLQRRSALAIADRAPSTIVVLAVRPRRAGERDVHRQHAAADGGRVGRHAAAVVHARCTRATRRR